MDAAGDSAADGVADGAGDSAAGDSSDVAGLRRVPRRRAFATTARLLRIIASDATSGSSRPVAARATAIAF